MLDEETKITLRNGVIVIGFLISVVSGYFYTIGNINDRLSALEKDTAYSYKYHEETAKRLDDFNDNQIKMMVALGIEPAAQRKER